VKRIYSHSEQVEIIETLQRENKELRLKLEESNKSQARSLDDSQRADKLLNTIIQQRNDLAECVKRNNGD